MSNGQCSNHTNDTNQPKEQPLSQGNPDASRSPLDVWGHRCSPAEIESAVNAGLISRDLLSRPGSYITKEQFAAVMVRSLELAGFSSKPAAFAFSTDAPYRAGMTKTPAADLLETDTGKMQPCEPVTRDEAASIIQRALVLSARKTTAFADNEVSHSGDTAVPPCSNDPVTVEEAASAALRVFNQLPFVLAESTIPALQAAMTTGKITARQLVQLYLDRIEAYDRQGPKLNSLLAVSPTALEDAAQLDAERARQSPRGPLHGIPIILKDNFNTKDMPTTGGAAALEGFTPSEDAAVVDKLRTAGAIILAKANMHELAITGTTVSSLGGQTLNPYDLTRTPGGSSGGTGAAIAASFAAAGTGSDTVNSIRSPSSANNLVGIRPTKGLVETDGILPVSFTQDTIGPIARTVEDAAILLEGMIGGGTEAAPGTARYSASLTNSLAENGLQGVRIGVLGNFFGARPVHEEVNRVANEVINSMKAMGAEIVPITIPGLDSDRLIAGLDVQKYELKEELNRYFAAYGTPIQSLEQFIAMDLHDRSIREALESAQAVERPDEQMDYRERLDLIRQLKAQVLDAMESSGVEVLLYPLQKRLVVPIGEFQADRNGILGALSGFPAITFQGGFSAPTPTAPIGVPVGIEFLGRPYSEAFLIKLAYSFEQQTRYRTTPPTTPELGIRD